MRDRFIEMPLSASAAPICSRGTTCGTMAENTGQRMASPTPLTKVSASSQDAVSAPVKDSSASTTAVDEIHNCVTAK